MRILILGAEGMLGRYMTSYLRRSHIVIRQSRRTLDIYKSLLEGNLHERLSELIDRHRVSLIINCAGITNKRQSLSVSQMYAVNAVLPSILDSLASESLTVVHPSTDCIYSGANGPYSHAQIADCDDDYGLSKRFGECLQHTCVIRGSIIGEETRGDSLIEWAKSKRGQSVAGFTNHLWNGITCLSYAQFIEHLISSNGFWRGVRNVGSSLTGLSKYELLGLISRHFHLDLTIIPTEVSTARDRRLVPDFVLGDMETQIFQLANYQVDTSFERMKQSACSGRHRIAITFTHKGRPSST